MGKIVVGTVAVVSALLLTGCSGPGGPNGIACPAIAWFNKLTVNLEGDTSPVAVVQGCVDGECSHYVQLQLETDVPVHTLEPGTTLPTKAPESSEAETREVSPHFSSRVDSDTWAIQFSMSSPDDVTVRALDERDRVLAEEAFTLTWTRVGGTEECGGPAEAGPVTLSIP